MHIRIIKEKPGYGALGDILDVSPERAERWVQMGLAELLRDIAKKPRGRRPKKKEK